jgi:signal transduction histidine kinase
VIARRRRSPQPSRLPELLHDVRQPVSAILLLAEASACDPDDPAVVRRRLRQIRAEALWLSHLVESVSDGDELRLVNLAEVIVDCIDRVAAASDATIRVHDVPDLRVPASPVGLRRALTNIVSNAARAVAPHGEVHVRVDVGDDVVIRVIDDGPGFGTLPVVHGDGLGIARASLGRFGGRLEIAGRSDGRTCVSLVLGRCRDSVPLGEA